MRYVTLLARLMLVGIVGSLAADLAEWLGDPIGSHDQRWGGYVYGLIVANTMPWIWRPFDRQED